MMFADKTSGIQHVTFFNTKFSKILHKVHYRYTYLVVYFVVTFVYFVVKMTLPGTSTLIFYDFL